MAFVAKIRNGEEGRLYFDPYGDSFDLFLISRGGALENLKCMFELVGQKSGAVRISSHLYNENSDGLYRDLNSGHYLLVSFFLYPYLCTYPYP